MIVVPALTSVRYDSIPMTLSNGTLATGAESRSVNPNRMPLPHALSRETSIPSRNSTVEPSRR